MPRLLKIEMRRDTTAWHICALLIIDHSAGVRFQSEFMRVEEITATKSYLSLLLHDTHLIAVH